MEWFFCPRANPPGFCLSVFSFGGSRGQKAGKKSSHGQKVGKKGFITTTQPIILLPLPSAPPQPSTIKSTPSSPDCRHLLPFAAVSGVRCCLPQSATVCCYLLLFSTIHRPTPSATIRHCPLQSSNHQIIVIPPDLSFAPHICQCCPPQFYPLSAK